MLSELPNLELVILRSKEVVLREPVTIEKGRYEMSMTVAENGDTVLRLPPWCSGLFVLRRSEREGVIELYEPDDKVSEIVRVFDTFGCGAR